MKHRHLTALILLDLIVVWAFLDGGHSAMILAQESTPVVKVAYEDLPRIVAANNSLLEARQSEVRASQARTGHLERSFFPELQIESSFDTFRFGSGSWRSQPELAITARVNLFNGGRDSIQENINQALLNRSQTYERLTYRELLFRARSLYWQKRYNFEKYQIIEEALQANQTHEVQARRRLNAGRGSRTDVMEFELQRNEWLQTKAQTSLTLRELGSELGAILGFDGNTTVQLSSSLAQPVIFPNEVSHSEEHHHLIGTLETDSQIKGMQAELARRSYYPRVDLFGGVQQYNQRERDEDRSWERFEQVVGVRLIVPLGIMAQANREQLALQHEAEAIQKERQQRLREFEQHIVIERKRAQAIEQQIRNASSSIELAKKHMNLILEDYRLGVKSSQDVLSASQRVLELRLGLASLTYESKLAYSHLESFLEH